MKISNRMESPVGPVLTPLLCALSAWLLLTANALALDATALPGGGVVTAGAVSISNTASTLGIQQSSQRAAINWQSFNIGSAATVNFVQPSSTSVVLNRITGNEASQIFGRLNSNGLVFFSNPNGMLFARGSEVNVGGLLATTLRLNDEGFMAGESVFANPGAGGISNAGILNARGTVALVGNAVHNSGQITATTVTLASGNAVAVDLTGDGLIRARITEPSLRSSIENSGSINASMAVTLTAGQSQGALDRVVNNTGVIRATGFTSRGGEILLDGASIDNTGSISASGNLGGGTIKLMGDMQGGRVSVGGTLDASAPGAGDGGFIETSAARVAVADSARITTASAKGRSGTWLIDPNDYTVAASGGDITVTALGSSLNIGNVTIQSASGATAGNGDIFVNDPIAWSSGNTLTLSAARDINIKSTVTATGVGAGLTLNANLGGTGGANTLTGAVTLNGGTLQFTGGPLTMLNGGKIVDGTVTSTNGSQLLVGGPPVVSGVNTWYWGTGTLDGVVLDVDTTITNSNTLRYDNSLTIANGHKIMLNSTGETVYLSGGTNGAQLLAAGGTGEVLFGGSSIYNQAITAYHDTPYALTIGPNVLIHGAQEGTVGSDFTALTNKGTIQTDTATVGLKFSSFSNAAGGVVNVNTGGNLNLSGNFNSTGLSGVTFNRLGGAVNLTGTMTNTGNTFSLDGIGTLNMTQWTSKIVGGALTSTKGYQLVVGNSQPWQSATLDGIVLDIDTIVSDRTELVLSNITSNSRAIQTGVDSKIITNNANLTNAAAGTISGLGTLTLGTGTLTNNGTINPGSASATGRLKLVGNLINNGTIQTRIGGACNCDDSDVLEVSGNATLGGTLTATLVNGFTPGGQPINVVVATTMSGSFATLNLPAGSSSSAAITGTTTKAFTVTANGGTSTPLPTLDQCLASPSILGCSAVLPSLATCTASPTTAGCSVVVPSLSSCIATPTLSGCASVLPSLALCTTTPATLGCTVVLPSLSTCTASPTTAGCSAVLPSASTCAAAPTTPGCTTSTPSLTSCIATPTLSGCASVLPSLALCTTTPATLGCTVVLPSLSACMSSPTAPGCSAVLPSATTCSATPSTPGCPSLLPSIAACIANPGLASCSSVLPTLATCTSAPSTAGCSVVLPSFATCVANPATAGCQAVLPTIASCVSDPAMVGCSAVQPTLATCKANPSTAGCSVVLLSTSSQTVISQVATITQSAIQGATSATSPSVMQVVPVTALQTQPTSASPAPSSSTDSSTAGGGGSTTSGTSSVSTTTPTNGSSAATAQSTSTASSTETVATVEEKVVAKPVITTVLVANTTVQKPAELVVQPAQAKGKVLICKR
jgi:filamentous hemagglutinin family protein